MCGEVVTASLQAKYGDPARRQDAVQQNDCLNPSAGGIAGLLGQLCSAYQPSHRVFIQCESNGILITLERDMGSTSNWWAVYKSVAGRGGKAVRAEIVAASKIKIRIFDAAERRSLTFWEPRWVYSPKVP